MRKLLLADDSITIQKVIDLTFADEGFAVTTVGNGEEAIEKLAEVMPDIVLADVFMPGKSGYEVCEHIKRNAQLQHVPVILLVGSFEPFDETEARRVGADDVLTKPFQSIRQLVNKVGALLGGAAKDNSEENYAAPAHAADATPPDSLRDETDARITAYTGVPEALNDTQEKLASHESSATAAEPEGAFNDVEMDDAMIEATPVDEFNRQHESTRHTTPFSPRDVIEVSHDMKANDTQPLREESDELGDKTLLSFAPQQAETNTPVEDERASAPEVRAEPQTASSSPMAGASAADEALLDLGDIAPPSAANAEADDFILDLRDALDDRPVAAQPAPPSSTVTTSASTSPDSDANMDAATLVDFEEKMTDAAPHADAYGEAQSVSEEQRGEFAAVEDHRAESFAAIEPPASAPAAGEQTFYGFEETRAASVAPAEIAVPQWETPDTQTSAETFAESASESAAPPIADQLDSVNENQLSPEVIDRIARRVVEHLSEQVIREIAWEVVPQLAELIIKRRLEEKESQTQ